MDSIGVIEAVWRETWQRFQYQYRAAEKRLEREVFGGFRQFSLVLGWAITIHQSQGMTLDTMCLDLGTGAIATGQNYVALSRCKTLEESLWHGPFTWATCAPTTRFYGSTSGWGLA